MSFTKAFKKVRRNIKKTYLGQPVPKKFQNEFGKIYDKDEIEMLAIKIAKSRGIKIEKLE